MENDQKLWASVDELLSQSLLGPDPILDAALKASDAAGLPPIQVSACQGKSLQLLAQMQKARAILEIGTLAGYSTLWLARALPPDGHVVTLELDPKHAEVARANFARAHLKNIELRVGPAIESLPRLVAESRGPFDLVFIDADKPGTPDYFLWSLKLSRPGTLIVVDNVIRKGALVDKASTDPAVQGMRRFIQLLGTEPRVSATAIQTVGNKGYDGFVLALVTG